MKPSTRALLASSPYRRLFASRLISNVGNGMQPIALAFGILAIPGADPTSLSIVLAAQAIAVVLVLPLGGAVADRVGAARVVGLADLAISLLAFTAAVLFLTHTVTVPALVVIGILMGALNGLWYPAFTALTPDVVESEHLQPANAFVSIASNVGYIAGASLGGIIVATLGSGWAIAIDGVSFLVAGGLVFSIRRLSRSHSSGESMLGDITHGWRVFISYRWVVVGVLAFSFIVMSWHGSEMVLGPVLADDIYGGARGWSVVLAGQSLGLLVGGIIASRVRAARPLLVGMVFMFALPLWQLFLAFELPLAMVAFGAFLAGLAVEFFYVVWISAMQRHIPRESLSRVGAYDALGSLMFGPIGLALAGPLSLLIGLQQAFFLAAVISTLAIAASLMSRALREVRMSPEA